MILASVLMVNIPFSVLEKNVPLNTHECLLDTGRTLNRVLYSMMGAVSSFPVCCARIMCSTLTLCYNMCGLRRCHWLLAVSHHCSGSNSYQSHLYKKIHAWRNRGIKISCMKSSFSWMKISFSWMKISYFHEWKFLIFMNENFLFSCIKSSYFHA